MWFANRLKAEYESLHQSIETMKSSSLKYDLGPRLPQMYRSIATLALTNTDNQKYIKEIRDLADIHARMFD
jgi:hypothetical protein